MPRSAVFLTVSPFAASDSTRTPPPADPAPIPWADAQLRLADERFYWLATTHPRGHSHVRPVLAVWLDGAMYVTTSPTAQKARNLERDGHCTLTARTDDLDLVVEGHAARVTDPADLQAVADTYIAKYGWPVTVRDGAFDAPYGAPTSGPPPYQVYRITPTVIFGFGTDDALGPRTTRWTF